MGGLIGESTARPAREIVDYHTAIGMLLEEISATGRTSIERTNSVLRERLIEYTAGARIYFARRDATATADAWARARRVELGAAKKTIGDELAGLIEINKAVRAQVEAAGVEEGDAVLARLSSSGNSHVVAETSAAWHEMEMVLRGL